MAPGGTGNVERMVAGFDLDGRRMLDIGRNKVKATAAVCATGGMRVRRSG